MTNIFHDAATSAFHDVIVELPLDHFRPEVVANIIACASRKFAERMDAAFKAFDACYTADKLETVLLNQRAERAAAELLRAFQARKEVPYAMERFWATFNPPKPPRLF